MWPAAPLTLLLLLLLVAATRGQANGGISINTWHKTLVPQASLTGREVREVGPVSLIQCATEASRHPNTHLFCEPTCTTYDIQVGVALDQWGTGPVTSCWTKHTCVLEERSYSAGEYVVNDDCSISQCQLGSLPLYQGETAPKVKFSDLMAKNCIYLANTEEERTKWDAARDVCVNQLGGDLYVAGDLEEMKHYLANAISRGHVWIGAKGGMWVDGRAMTSEDWGENQSTGEPDKCVKFSLNGSAISEADCDKRRKYLCQKGKSYRPPAN